MISLLSNKLIIEHLTSVNSTNQTAIDFLKDNRHLDWIVAEEQLNGRGRRSNTWSSPIGGLYATRILCDEKIGYSNISQLSILASVVAAQTIEEVIGKNLIQLKWPNDIFLEGKKICGILIESVLVENKFYLIIGFGINVRRPNNYHEESYSYLQEIREEVSVDECFDKLIRNFNKIINKWDYGKSFTQFKDYWLMLTRDHGRVIKAKKNNVFIEGVFENIDDQGNLILRVGNKKEIINTGEIFR